MEIKPHFGATGIGGPVPPASPAARPATSGETAPFARSTALETALASAPDSRPEVVARARELINGTAYPTPETVQAISRLLAKQSASGSE